MKLLSTPRHAGYKAPHPGNYQMPMGPKPLKTPAAPKPRPLPGPKPAKAVIAPAVGLTPAVPQIQRQQVAARFAQTMLRPS